MNPDKSQPCLGLTQLEWLSLDANMITQVSQVRQKIIRVTDIHCMMFFRCLSSLWPVQCQWAQPSQPLPTLKTI